MNPTMRMPIQPEAAEQAENSFSVSSLSSCSNPAVQVLKTALVGVLGLACAPAFPQPVVPPQAVEQFQHVIGDRVEAVTILGGDYGAAGGIYSFRGGQAANLSIAKIGGGGDIAETRPLGESGVNWAPVLQGNLGHISARNEFATGYLEGNESVYDVLDVQLGVGGRFYFTDALSVAPAICGIYGHTENEFKPHNAVGDAVKAAARGTFVDWQLDTWSVAPSLDLRYGWLWQRTAIEFRSRYNFFHTEGF